MWFTASSLVSLLSVSTFLLDPVSGATDGFQTSCLAFKPESYVHNSTRTILEYVPAGTNLTFPWNDASCGRPSQVVAADFCRAALLIPTSNRSSVTFEMWLPRNWTGRFLGTGNGGIDGCVKYEDLAYTTQHGFATFGSNNGHNGTGGLAFFHNPDVVEDFAWRSLHTSTVVGKKLTKAFYKKAHHKSYYMGCSQGGRQGIHAAEIFPHDFDGILAGAPALNSNYLSSWRASFFPITGLANSTNFIKSATWTGLIHNEILRQCDALDGVVDGIIEDPSLCLFRPEALLCGNVTNTTNCLSSVQVKMVRDVFAPLYGEQGQLIYPGLQPGAETMAVAKLIAGSPFSYSEDWFKYVVYSNASWDAAKFNIHDATVAETLNPFNIRTWPSTLQPFASTGGKILTYHGGQDNQITGFNTEVFYNRLSRGMNETSTQLDTFLRFFRISGMGHCNSGPGAWVLGQGGNVAATGNYTKESNLLAAMVAWVENGTAPETIVGTKFVNDASKSGIQFQRRHCRYPFRNTFIGGNGTALSSWVCM